MARRPIPRYPNPAAVARLKRCDEQRVLDAIKSGELFPIVEIVHRNGRLEALGLDVREVEHFDPSAEPMAMDFDHQPKRLWSFTAARQELVLTPQEFGQALLDGLIQPAAEIVGGDGHTCSCGFDPAVIRPLAKRAQRSPGL